MTTKPNIRILVADDDPLMRTFVAITLTDVAEVVEAADGTEALQRLQNDGPFDLLLLDWDMPCTDGLEVLKAMRRQGCEVPVFMVTAKNERVDVLKAIHAGASDYLIKPFDSNALHHKVSKVCSAMSQPTPCSP